ncbi:DUF2950 domain-containing protein [Roseococcus sp. YIM B11640]|uniref:DUF2950 domain-containing protein n=1 Tax=Roseococcus sp. YIM B11640 TaxID=3133973 RepID=UPI003C7C67C1
MIRTLLRGGMAASFATGLAWAQAPVQTPAEAPAAAPAPVETPQPRPPRAYRTPEEGFAALADAARRANVGALAVVMGDVGVRLLRSGDRVADAATLRNFAAAYDAKREILRSSPDRATIQVGEDGWPLPIPMVQRGGSWRFDARAGSREIVDRRIGHNELDTIETLRAIVDAQQDFAATAGRQGAFRTYARRFFSTPGQRDGLYWETQPGQPESPLGPVMAAASSGGYARTPGDRPQPYHGYLFRILESQGPSAPGGAMDYVVNGRMIGGFAVIASPAIYGASGIMTFMAGHDGTVWQKDLGPGTAREAAGITSFDPGEGWARVPD